MKQLTTTQRDFLLDNFFRNERYAGWRSIGIKLIDTGQCIVAGDKCIWNGGVGNFICTEDAKDAVDCLLYKFDLEYFLRSQWYKSIHEQHVTILRNKLKIIEDDLKEISILV